MHRSGTSTLTRICNLLGAELSGPLLGPSENVNSKGFWELREAIRFNERLLAALESKWDDVRFLPANWWTEEKLKPYAEELSGLITRHFGQDALWAIKDPRLCKMIPLWISVLEKLNIAPLFILPIRDPYEVCMSLEKRDHFTPAKSLLLWLQHTLEAEHHSRSFPRVITSYDKLLLQPEELMTSISTTLGIEWPVPYANVSAKIESFINPTLKHCHNSAHDNDIPAAPCNIMHWVQRTMNALTQPGESNVAEFTKIREEILAYLNTEQSLPVNANDSLPPELCQKTSVARKKLFRWKKLIPSISSLGKAPIEITISHK